MVVTTDSDDLYTHAAGTRDVVEKQDPHMAHKRIVLVSLEVAAGRSKADKSEVAQTPLAFASPCLVSFRVALSVDALSSCFRVYAAPALQYRNPPDLAAVVGAHLT